MTEPRLELVDLVHPDDVGVIVGQAHFVKTVEAARAIGAGHVFVVLLKGGYPVNVLSAVKAVPEVCHVFVATSNPLQVLVARTDLGGGVVGVVDGSPSLGTEDEHDEAARKDLLRTLGYKL